VKDRGNLLPQSFCRRPQERQQVAAVFGKNGVCPADTVTDPWVGETWARRRDTLRAPRSTLGASCLTRQGSTSLGVRPEADRLFCGPQPKRIPSAKIMRANGAHILP